MRYLTRQKSQLSKHYRDFWSDSASTMYKKRPTLVGRIFFCCLKEKFGIVLMGFGHHGDDEAGQKADRGGNDTKKRRIAGLEAGENRQPQRSQKTDAHAPDRSRFVHSFPVEAQQVTGQEGGANSAPGEGHQSQNGRLHGG